MSYDIELVDAKGKTLELAEPHFIRGGTYAVGGTTRAALNITYNYAKFFYETIDPDKGIRWLYGKRAADTVLPLTHAILALDRMAKTFVYVKPETKAFLDITVAGSEEDDYWAATPKNAAKALRDLLHLAVECPEGIWSGD